MKIILLFLSIICLVVAINININSKNLYESENSEYLDNLLEMIKPINLLVLSMLLSISVVSYDKLIMSINSRIIDRDMEPIYVAKREVNGILERHKYGKYIILSGKDSFSVRGNRPKDTLVDIETSIYGKRMYYVPNKILDKGILKEVKDSMKDIKYSEGEMKLYKDSFGKELSKDSVSREEYKKTMITLIDSQYDEAK